MQISIIADELVSTDKSGYLGNVSGFVTVKDLEMFAKICLKYHICCGLFFNNKRNLEDFREIWFLQFDFDNGITHEEVIKKIGKNVNMVIMASKNHLKDKNDGKGAIPRFHVFLPLQKQIVEPDFYHFCVKYLAKKWDVPIDPQATDSTRYMFKHSKCLYIQNGGWNFDVESVVKLKWKMELEEQEKENQKRTEWLKKDNANFNITFEERMVAAKKLIREYVGDSVSGMGGDVTTFKAMCYGVKCGLTDDILKEFANWYNDTFCKPKWSNKALLHKIKCAKKRVQSGDMLSARYIMKIIGKQDYMQYFK
jgi:hypothetical protein